MHFNLKFPITGNLVHLIKSIKSLDTEIKMAARTTELFHAVERCYRSTTPGTCSNEFIIKRGKKCNQYSFYEQFLIEQLANDF